MGISPQTPDDAPTEVVSTEETLVERPPPPPPDRNLWPWLLLLLVLVLAGLGAAFYLGREDDEPQAAPQTTRETTATTAPAFPVEVPKVVGLREDEAVARLEEAGLKAIVAQSSSPRPRGVVIDQSPEPGESSERGGEVAIVVSRGGGQAQTTSPPTTAQETTTTTVTTTTETRPATTAPPPQPANATVPDVMGQELADAADALAEVGLRAYVRYVPSSEPKGTVVQQAKQPGTTVRSGSSVGVNASIGPDEPPLVNVPDVTGRDERAARDALRRAGFEIRAYAVETDPSRRGTVLEHQPQGRAPRGALVLLYVGD